MSEADQRSFEDFSSSSDDGGNDDNNTTLNSSSDTTEGADEIIDTDDDFMELEQDIKPLEQTAVVDKDYYDDTKVKVDLSKDNFTEHEPKPFEDKDIQQHNVLETPNSPLSMKDPKSPTFIGQKSKSSTLLGHEPKSPSGFVSFPSPTFLAHDPRSPKSPLPWHIDAKSPTFLCRDSASPASETRSECESQANIPGMVQITSRSRRTNTTMTMKDVAFLIGKLESLLEEVTGHQDEVDKLNMKIAELTAKLSNKEEHHEKVRHLESQNALLREKSVEARKENDILVEKIQKLHSKISTEVRVSVSGIDEDIVDPDDPFFTPGLPSSSGDMGEGVHGSPHSHSGHHPLHHHQPQPDVVQSPDLERKVKGRKEMVDRSMSYTAGGGDVNCTSHQQIIRSTEKKYEDAVEKIMRLEQRIVCLQNANNLNSCATCRPLRKHVMKIERQLLGLVQERKTQLEQLFQLKQVALSSAVSEKDAHLAWLEATGEGNVHTMSSIEKLRKERRDILNRMKEENENRMKLLAKLEENPTLFTGPAKLSAIGALGDNFIDDEFQSTSSIQSSSAGDLGDIQTNPIFLLSPSDTPPQAPEDQIHISFAHHEDDKDSVKSF